MIRLTAVAFWPFHTRKAAALAGLMVAVGGALPVTVALSAVFGDNGVAKVPGLAAVTGVAVGVRQANLATARYPVTGRGVGSVNVAVTKARLTISS